MPYGYYFDPTYILVIIGAVICMIAQFKVKSTYSKYSKVASLSGMTGAEAASMILHSQGIYDVKVEHISGELTDHYDPSKKILRLSDAVYAKRSVAAIGVAAHECGHAMQHHKGYTPLTIRSSIVPIANFGSALSWPIIILGVIMGFSHTLITIGILLFSFAVAFQLITLPVEFNASNRAVKILSDTRILNEKELSHTKKVLGAAALTYVASAAAAILQLLRLIILFGGRDRDK